MELEKQRQRAKDGSVVYQTHLGCSYLYGTDVEIDYEEAFLWLTAAAARGAPRAVANLGIMYAEGLGVAKNIPEAMRLLEKGAQSGEYASLLGLARIYARGEEGVPVNEDAALRWYAAFMEDMPTDDVTSDMQEAIDYIAKTGT